MTEAMAEFIASRIILERKKSLEAGQAKYRGYFITTSLYVSWKQNVDTILTVEGFSDCIVTA